MTTYNKRVKSIIFYSLIFVFFLVFFYKIHPIFPFDSDDWKYLSFHRPALPIWGVINPTKVLPEILQPLCSSIAAYLFYPFMDDYIDSMALMYSITKAFAITVYLIFFRVVFGQIRAGHSYVYILLFLLCHFLLLSGGREEHDYLMYDIDATYLFHYTIPNLLCFSIAILILYRDDFLENLAHFPSRKITTFLFVMYWALLSSLYANIMIIAVICVDILINYVRAYRSTRKGIVSFVKNNKIKFILLFIWFVILVFEVNGGRATSLQSKHPVGLFSSFLQTLIKIKYITWNIPVISSMGLSIILSSFLIKNDRKMKSIYAKTILSALFTFIFVIFAESRAHPTLLMKGVVCFSFMSFFIFLFILSIIVISERIRLIKYSLPVCFCILASTLLMYPKTFVDSNYYDKDSDYLYTIEEKKMMMKNVIDEIIDASEAGKDSVVINIPLILPYHGTNWPLSAASGNRLSDALYRHNITDKRIDVTLIPINNYTLGKRK